MDTRLPQQISRIVFRCSEQTKGDLVSRVQIHEGSMLTDELLQQTRETAEAYNQRLATLVVPTLDKGVNVVIWDRAIPPQRIRIDGTEQNSRLIEKHMPTYACQR